MNRVSGSDPAAGSPAVGSTQSGGEPDGEPVNAVVLPGGKSSEAARPVEPLAVEPDGAAGVAVQSRGLAWGGGSQIDQIMPVVLFLVFYNIDAVRVAGLNNIEVAVIAATAWSVKAAYSRRRRGRPIGKWLPVITGYLIVRAGISVAVERDLVDFGVSTEAVYFGIGIGTKLLVGLAAAATILAGKPFALWLVRFIGDFPAHLRDDRRFVATMRNVTWVIALYEIGSSIWDIWLYNHAGVSSFVVIRFLGNYAASLVLIFATLVYVDRRFSKIEGCPSLVELLELITRRRSASVS